MPLPYGYHWRTITRPAILRRAGGVFDEQGRYQGGARCMRCDIPDVFPLSIWQRSQIDCAHLDANTGNDADENTAALCRTCHSTHDYPVWAEAFRAWLEAEKERRIAEKDAARPILAWLQNAVVETIGASALEAGGL